MGDNPGKHAVERIPVKFFREALGLALEAVKARGASRPLLSYPSSPAVRLGQRPRLPKKRTRAKTD